MDEWRVRILRRWYELRERLGFSRSLTEVEFDQADATTLLAGSPWIRVDNQTTTTCGTTSVTWRWTTSTGWDRA